MTASQFAIIDSGYTVEIAELSEPVTISQGGKEVSGKYRATLVYPSRMNQPDRDFVGLFDTEDQAIIGAEFAHDRNVKFWAEQNRRTAILENPVSVKEVKRG